MSVFRTLAQADPFLWETLQRKGAEAASPRERQSMADRLRLRAASIAVAKLRSGQRKVLGVVGDRDLGAQLLSSGILDGFEKVVLLEAEPASPLFAPGIGLVESLPLSASKQAGALLVLDEEQGQGLPEACAGPVQVVPNLTANNIPFAVPSFWRQAYDEALGGLFSAMSDSIARLDPKRTILFAGIYTYFNQGKLSMALRRRGFQTAFLCLNPSNQAHKQGFFDVILNAGANLELFYGLLAKHRFRAVHFQGWLGLHCFAAAAAALSVSPVITEFNDLPNYCFTDEEYDRLFAQGEAAAEHHSISVALSASSGVALNYRDGSVGTLVEQYSTSPPLIHLHSHPLKEFFADVPLGAAGRRSLVFCGTLNPSNYPAPPFGDVQLLGLIRELAAQGVAFNVFLNPYQRKGERGAFWDYEYLARTEPLFTVHEGVGPDQLPATIGGFGWGSMVYRFPEVFTMQRPHLSHILPTKFFSFLEAGLPVIVSRELEAVSELVREHGLGLVVGQDEISRLGGLIDEVDYEALRQNVRVYRAEHDLDGRLNGLLKLYSKVEWN
ncbi:MAG: hypothetical protein HY795_03550 [Desulfovibrio sp.]|nr:hypothetical protein [Desulfovibrio sp.]MBI4957964.1 hypothetical protein [Desulfovibrio sp.]